MSVTTLREVIPLIVKTDGRRFNTATRKYEATEILGSGILSVGEVASIRKGNLWKKTIFSRPAARKLLCGSHPVGATYDEDYARADKAEECALSAEGFAARTERLKLYNTTLCQQFADFDKSSDIAAKHSFSLEDVSNGIFELSISKKFSVDQRFWLTSQEAADLRKMLVMTLPDDRIVEKVLALKAALAPAVEEAVPPPIVAAATEAERSAVAVRMLAEAANVARAAYTLGAQSGYQAAVARASEEAGPQLQVAYTAGQLAAVAHLASRGLTVAM